MKAPIFSHYACEILRATDDDSEILTEGFNDIIDATSVRTYLFDTN